MAEKIEYIINVDSSKATKNVDNLNKSIGGTAKGGAEAKSGIGGIGEALEKLGGPIGGAIGGAKSLNQQLLALVANPIGAVIAAIVLAVTALFKAFTSTKKGGEQFDQMMAGLGAALNVLRDVLVGVTENLIKMFQDPKKALMDFWKLLKENVINRFEGLLELLPALGKSINLLFKGQFSEAGKVAADAVGKVTLGVENMTDKIGTAIDELGKMTNQAIEDGKKAAAIEKQLQKVADAERKLATDKARLTKAIEAARAASEDENKSFEERKKKAKEAGDLEVQLAQRESSLAKQRYNLIKQRNALTSETKEGIAEEADALQKVYDLDAQLSAKRRDLKRQDKEFSIQIMQNELAKIQIAYQGIVETYDNAAEKQRQLRDDEQLAIKDRIAANEKLGQVLTEGEATEKANIQSRIDGIKEINKQYGESPERLNEIKALEEEIKGVTAKYAGQRSEQLVNTNSLLKEQADILKSIGETEVEVSKIQNAADIAALEGTYKVWDAKKKALDAEYEANKRNLEAQKANYKEGTAAYQEVVNQLAILDAQHTADSEAQTKERVQFEKDARAAQLSLGSQTFGALNDLASAFYDGDKDKAKEAFEVNKKLSIAQALMSTFEAVNAALASPMELFPGQRFITAALAGVTGLANVVKISKTKFESNSPESPEKASPITSGPSIGIMGANVNPSTQLAGVINQQTKPIKAYVVGQDVNSQQSLDRHIRQNATV